MNPKAELVYYSKECYRRGFLGATDGNLSIKTSRNTIYTTKTGICKGKIATSDIIEVNFKSGSRISGRGMPSTELKMHLFIYQSRKDIKAVIHTHPIFSSAFAVSGNSLEKNIFPEILLQVGTVPLADYACPSTDEVPESISKYVNESKAILLSNHGLVAYGGNIEEAFFITEKVERAAEIIFYARMLGGERELSQKQVEKLRKVFHNGK